MAKRFLKAMRHNNPNINYRHSGMDMPGGEDSLVEPNGGERISVADVKRVVFIRVVFMKIGEIDTAKEFFSAEAFIQAKWREQKLDHRTDIDKKLIVYSEYWSPKLYVDNNHGEPKETIWNSVMFNADGEAFMCERRKIKGNFVENLELEEFPFDVQDLQLTITSERSDEQLELLPDPTVPSSVNCNSFVDEQEWELYECVDARPATIGKVYEEWGRINHPSLSFACQAARRYGFFFWNIFFVMFFICSMTFVTFAISFTKPENRIQVSFILILTTVAFRTNVNSSLPKISYLTYLDIYIIACMVLQCLVCVWHGIVGGALNCIIAAQICPVPPVDPLKAHWADKGILIVLGFVYIVANIAFFVYIYVKVHLSRPKKQQQRLQHGVANSGTSFNMADRSVNMEPTSS